MERTIKILLVGESCSGKTTLQEALANDPFFDSFNFKQEIVRWNTKMHHLKLNKESDTRGQAFFNEIYRNNMNMYASRQNLIIDRGAICSVVFMDGCNIDPIVKEETIKLAKMQLEAVDIVVLTKAVLEKVEKADNYRETDIEFQKKCHKKYVDLLRKWGFAKKTLILGGATKERVRVIKHYARQLIKDNEDRKPKIIGSTTSEK